MEWSTIVLAIVLVGVTTSALFVFVSAARLYVSDAADEADHKSPRTAQRDRRGMEPSGRQGDRRRRDDKVEFPLRLGDLIIENDRRRVPDRRQGIVH